MAYTRHGHHIEGSFRLGKPLSVARCGGPGLCGICTIEADRWRKEHVSILPDPRPIYEELMGEEKMPQVENPHDFTLEARLIVREAAAAERGTRHALHELHVVWFSKTLQHWKALVWASTPADDAVYYEVTHNGDKNETYVDAYTKLYNHVIR